mgnify:CR=1 FL=1
MPGAVSAEFLDPRPGTGLLPGIGVDVAQPFAAVAEHMGTMAADLLSDHRGGLWVPHCGDSAAGLPM